MGVPVEIQNDGIIFITDHKLRRKVKAFPGPLDSVYNIEIYIKRESFSFDRKGYQICHRL